MRFWSKDTHHSSPCHSIAHLIRFVFFSASYNIGLYVPGEIGLDEYAERFTAANVPTLAAGMYHKMGISSMVAESIEEYVNVSVRP